MPTGIATVLLIVLRVGAPADSARRVAWRLEPGVGCPTPGQLQAAFLAHRDEPEGDRVVAEVSLDRPTKWVLRVGVATLTDPPFDVWREILVRESSCQELAQTVALLVDAWLRGLPELAPRDVVALTATRPKPTALPPKMLPMVPAEDLTVSAKLSAFTPSAPRRFKPTVGVALGGAAVIGSITAPGVMLGIDVQVSSRFGVTAVGTWIGDSSVDDFPFGSIFLQRQLLELEGTLRLVRVGGFSLDALAGPMLWHGNVESLGYPATRSADLFDPGLAAGARVDQHLIGALRLRGQVGGVALARSYSLSIDRPGGGPATVGLLRGFALDASLGAAIDLF